MTSVFASYASHCFPYAFKGKLHVRNIAGGTPSDPKVAEGWLKSKFASKDTLIKRMVNEVIAERGTLDKKLFDEDGNLRVTDEEDAAVLTDMAIEEVLPEVNLLKHLNGFKRDEKLGLYIDGRQLKAAIKEAASVAVAAGKLNGRGWGKTNKGLQSYVAEHIFVTEERLYLGVNTADSLEQRFVHTWRGTGIQYEELVHDAEIDFTVTSDHDFSAKEWAMIWGTGEQQGIGASRSQGYGRYEVVEWEPLSARERAAVTRKTKAKRAVAA